ncbi:MAG: outer membrane protein assembly factor BamE, partial [Gemmatimonadetes bacterium]|nr:outer membrane protein assembly factor BamE [Gemmatimonadota bacterium]
MALAACSPTRVTSGNLPDPDKVAQIEPGKQTRAQVAALLGTPSSVSTFDGQAWYYIGKRTERLA